MKHNLLQRKEGVISVGLLRLSAIFAFFALFLLGCPQVLPPTDQGLPDDPIFDEGKSDVTPPAPAEDVSADDPAARLDVVQVDLDLPAGRSLFLDGVAIDSFSVAEESVDPEQVAELFPAMPQNGLLRVLVTDYKGNGEGHTSWGYVENGHNPHGGQLGRLLGWLLGYHDYKVLKIELKLQSIEVYSQELQSWISLVDYGEEGRVIDFLKLKKGKFVDLGTYVVTPGTYTGIRMFIGESFQEIEENYHSSEGPKPVYFDDEQSLTGSMGALHQFEVSALQDRTVVMDVDVINSHSRGKKKHHHDDHWYKFIPTVTAKNDQAEPVITAKFDSGGTLEIVNDVKVHLPDGALSEETTIALIPKYKMSIHSSLDYMTFGREYLIEPAAVQLNAAVEFSMNIPALYPDILNVINENIDIRRFDVVEKKWIAETGAPVVEENVIKKNITGFGDIGIGEILAGEKLLTGACNFIGDELVGVPIPNGIDIALFDKACQRHEDCYAHGYKTYHKGAALCDFDLAVDTLAVCEAVCEDNLIPGGTKCKDLADDAKDLAKEQGIWNIYLECRYLAQAMYEKTVADSAANYPGDEVSTCEDFENLGVSCELPTCSLAVDKAQINADTPTDLSFTLDIGGSIYNADFDGSVVFLQSGVPVVANHQIIIHDVGISLSEDTTFTASVFGPGTGEEPVTCNVTVAVSSAEPCTIVVVPSQIHIGEYAVLTMTVEPGYYPAYLDLRRENVFSQVGLSTPDEQGRRFFSSYVVTTGSRGYHGKVLDIAANEYFCTTYIVVDQ